MSKRVHFSASMDKISQLPQVLLQHIQYLLSPKQAAQTIILSKAWLNAWSNRPNIDFDEFFFRGTRDEFLSHVHNTLQGYHDHKLRINPFQLGFLKLDSESVSLLEKWIPILIYMGVEKFHLNIYQNSKLHSLPRAIFDVESLVELSLNGCRLYQAVHDKVMFKHLKVLKLSKVYITETTFQRIISSCPLIEDMELVCCEGLQSIKVNDLKNLKKFYFVYSYYSRAGDPSIEWGVTNLESITIYCRANWFHLLKSQVFPNLKYLSVTKVSLSGISSYDFSCYFPSLEYLVLADCHGFDEEIQISSNSIQHFGLRIVDRSVKARIDAPNIHSFEYSGNIPSIISFAKTYSKWISDITLYLDDASSLVWFKLNEMLKELSQSEITLNIFKLPKSQQNNNVVHFKPVEVENVILHSHAQNSSSGVNGLLCVCRPKNVEVYWYRNEDGEWERERNEFAEYVCKILMDSAVGDQFTQLIWQKDLKEVSLSTFDYTLYEWRPLHGTTLRKCALPNIKYRQQIRFQLKWT